MPDDEVTEEAPAADGDADGAPAPGTGISE
jgi:hypothetical protein